MFGAPFDGKDTEYGECSHPFPFFGMHGKNSAHVDQQNLTTTTMNSLDTEMNTAVDTEMPTSSTTTRREQRNENLPGVVPPEKDSLYPHRLCSGELFEIKFPKN